MADHIRQNNALFFCKKLLEKHLMTFFAAPLINCHILKVSGVKITAIGYKDHIFLALMGI
jgi:hypothetical protein